LKKLLVIILTMSLVLGNLGFASALPGNSIHDDGKISGDTLKSVIDVMKDNVKGENAFDYMSYVYMGWRTTGGPWQNHIIKNYLTSELENAGYLYSKEDKSSATNQDYVWIQHDDSDELVWAPQYASLEVKLGDGSQTSNPQQPSVASGDVSELIDTFNVESSSFDPTSDIYMDYYGDEYGIESVDDMYQWITKKEDGTRTNVENGLEAELNKRAHLARNSCFTDPTDTQVDAAKGVEGEAVYVGEVANITENGTKVYYGTETGLEGNADLHGKVLLSDSRNSLNFELAKQVGAVAVMTTYALDDYNHPTIDGVELYTDSARYAGGASAAASLAQMTKDAPIVQWNLSLDQEAALKELLVQSKDTNIPVIIKSVSIGNIYSMAFDNGGEGQLTAIAEIKGTTKADERVIFMAHVQEPGACDNASGVGLQLEMALKLKEMIDSGLLKRPERTITFIWGDEMTCSELWLNAHPNEKSKVVGTIDLDMVGEDPAKTGGPMRIEKTPDPSAFYNYTLDLLPGQETPSDVDAFVRLPDSHTLWGAGDPPEIAPLYINDLYMAATQEVIRSVDPGFKVAVCPFEGGSDHQVFLEAGIPAVLTWHFTDYVYHTTVDTLDKASAREMENVGITSLAAGYMAAIAGEYQANEMMSMIYDAAAERFRLEEINTENHYDWTVKYNKDMDAELALELEILDAWGNWYLGAVQSCETYFLQDNGTKSYQAAEANYIKKINRLMENAKANAQNIYASEKKAS